MKSILKTVAIATLAVGLTSVSLSAQAYRGGGFGPGVVVGAAVGAVVGLAARSVVAPPVYVAPAPVYVTPAPVYAPAPVVYAPPPVVYRPAYVVPPVVVPVYAAPVARSYYYRY